MTSLEQTEYSGVSLKLLRSGVGPLLRCWPCSVVHALLFLGGSGSLLTSRQMCEGDVGLTARTPQGPNLGGMVTGMHVFICGPGVGCAYVWTHACECVWGACACVWTCVWRVHMCAWYGHLWACVCVWAHTCVSMHVWACVCAHMCVGACVCDWVMLASGFYVLFSGTGVTSVHTMWGSGDQTGVLCS